jgi:hypothetical protein
VPSQNVRGCLASSKLLSQARTPYGEDTVRPKQLVERPQRPCERSWLNLGENQLENGPQSFLLTAANDKNYTTFVYRGEAMLNRWLI